MLLDPIPTFGTGFARSASGSEFPGLWRGLVGLFAPSLGQTGAGPGGSGVILPNWSGSGLGDGQLQNMASANWVVSEKGYVLDYEESSDQFVSIPLFSNPDMTVSLWAKAESFGNPVPNINGLFSVVDVGTSFAYLLRTDEDGVEIELIRELTSLTAVVNLVVGTWYHIVGVIRSDDSAEIFLDGKSVGSGALDTFTGTADQAEIGSDARTANRYWDGLIGDVFVYYRALSANEIASLFAGASPLTLKRRSLYFVQAGILKQMQQMDQYSGGAIL